MRTAHASQDDVKNRPGTTFGYSNCNEHERAYEIDPSSNISAYDIVVRSMVYGGIWTPVYPAVIAYLAMCAAKSAEFVTSSQCSRLFLVK